MCMESIMSKAHVICDNCRGANRRECQAPISLSVTQDGRIKNTSFVCCDNVVNWIEQSLI